MQKIEPHIVSIKYVGTCYLGELFIMNKNVKPVGYLVDVVYIYSSDNSKFVKLLHLN